MANVSKKPVSMPSREQIEAEMHKIKYKKRFTSTLFSTVSILIVVAAVAVLVSTLFFPVVQVSGNSMEPTLKNGDILVLLKSDKISYGDMCCVSWQNKTLLKRVIGLPGDTIEINEDFPTLGKPTNPTSANSFSSTITFFVSPGVPIVAYSGALFLDDLNYLIDYIYL